ncbi:MAG: general stress protein [Paracoccus denitrificans]|nr:MAG: general stress protein [Paracoccus denitrificans]PZO84554.1 MAG: general stress protein [Paracoccus denitrificans]
MADDKKLFWKRIEGVNAGMLGAAPDWRLVPMSHYADPDENALWFITAAGVDLVEDASEGPVDAVHAIGDMSAKIFARIEGKLSVSDDKAKLDELWGVVASTWFEDGKRDPDIRLLRFDISSAEVWATTGGIGFLYQVAKAKITGDEPDMGEHFEVTF